MNLHKNKIAFTEVIITTAQHMNLPQIYIEKDYWVSLCLRQISQSDIKDLLVFKGGTSLSKAYKLIHRFSEDIDLAALTEGMSDSKRKKLLKKTGLIASSCGLEEIIHDSRVSKGSKFRKTVYQYPHEINDNNFGQASPELLLEINCFTRPSPYQQMSMQTMIADNDCRHAYDRE